MSTIVPPPTDTQDDDWRLPADFWTITPLGLGARLTYEGAFPERPRDYYALTTDGWRRSFVYILSAWSPIYIGRSCRPGNRFDRHRRKPWFELVRNVTILAVEGDDSTDANYLADRLETFAIRRLKPSHNIAKVVA